MVGGVATFVAGAVLFTVGIIGVIDDRGEPAVVIVPPLAEGTDLNLRDEATPTSAPETESPTSSSTSTSSPTPEPTPTLPQDGYRLVIEKLSIDGVVDTYGLDENAIPQVPTGDGAGQVVAWYDFSARPGVGSNAVFAGHNSWFGTGIFRYIGDLVPGDEVRLVNDDGTEMLYTITDVFSVDPHDPESLLVMRATDKDVLTLITCSGTFVDTGDPVFGGEFTDRTIVRADLTSVTSDAVAAIGR
jgi:LPXTG-site transpeptidase (sortase) family protein